MATEAKSTAGGLIEITKTIFYAILIAVAFRTLFFQPFWIPSGSMKDTLLVGDFLFVNKMAYGYSYASCPSLRIGAIGVNLDAKTLCGFLDRDNTRFFAAPPERGDVVVFRHPQTGIDFIKRLIGLPGDRVQIRRGVIYLNGAPVPLEEAGVFTETKARQGPQGHVPLCANDPVTPGGDCHKPRFIETLPSGLRHNVLDITDRAPLDDTRVFTVPEGHYFFIGDNRDNSVDSRLAQSRGGVGFVPYENLIGRADRIMFSSAGRSMLAFWAWRQDRFFKAVQP